MTTRTRYTATYYYPGMLFPEEATRDIEATDWPTIEKSQPETGNYGWPPHDGFYAVRVRRLEEKLYKAEDGDEEWLVYSNHSVRSYVIGQKIHVDDISDDTVDGPGRNVILKSNIRANSKDGFGVLTRCGNWQIASDYDEVIYG